MAKTILVVEDNPLNSKLFNDLLKAAGYETVLCSDGALVIDTVVKTQPDLILMDIQLPNISGMDLSRTLKADLETAAIPIIAVTAHAMKGDEETILASGPDAYLSKPVEIPIFLDTIATMLGDTD